MTPRSPARLVRLALLGFLATLLVPAIPATAQPVVPAIPTGHAVPATSTTPVVPAVPGLTVRQLAASPDAMPNSFADVPSNYWAYSAINTVAQSHTWMQDFGPTTFQPATLESRELAARAMVEEFQPGTHVDPSITFNDLPSSDPFYPFANIAVQNGWLPTVNGNFYPQTPITMKQLHHGIVLGLGFGDIALGITNIHTKDGYVFQHQQGLGTLMLGILMALRYNHSDPSLDVEPWSAMPRSEVAWSLARAWTIKTSEPWLHSYLLPYKSMHLGPIPTYFRQVVEFGLAYTGYPYIYAGEWGTKTPAGYCCGAQPMGGFDCSGLTWWVMKSPENGYDPTKIRPYQGWPLPERSSMDMAAATPLSQRLPFDKAHAGDIMLYSSGGGVIDHADVYLGWGWALDSSNGYAGVAIQWVGSGWYRDHFVFARHIITSS